MRPLPSEALVDELLAGCEVHATITVVITTLTADSDWATQREILSVMEVPVFADEFLTEKQVGPHRPVKSDF